MLARTALNWGVRATLPPSEEDTLETCGEERNFEGCLHSLKECLRVNFGLLRKFSREVLWDKLTARQLHIQFSTVSFGPSIQAKHSLTSRTSDSGCSFRFFILQPVVEGMSKYLPALSGPVHERRSPASCKK